MKNLLLLTLSLIAVASYAQIPNNGFEAWITPSGQSYENPSGWGTSNDIGTQLPTPLVNVTKETTDPGAGTTSILMETKNITFTNVAGVALTGEITYSNTLKFSGGFPYNTRPGQLTGKIKYAPASTDSSFILAVLFKWNTTLSKRDTIATAVLSTGAISSWGTFGASFHYTMTESPDSALILLSSSKGFLGQAGSKLWIDDLVFQYGAGTEDINKPSLTVFPNPAQSTLYFNAIPGQYQAANIYSYTGILMLTTKLQGNNIDISTLPNGSYILTTEDRSGNIIRTMFNVFR